MSPTFTRANILPGSASIDGPRTFSAGGSNPNLPGSFFGTNWIPTPDTVGPPPAEQIPTPSAAAAGVVLVARKLKRRAKA